ncbi:MAG: 2'-5' RNA ligase family protein [Dehalococcoidia bacterium]|nr:2'-5' RNA ligase family protein [Dehalococcoidia bacterium]MDD5494236.1 2'-5' RNA ligase family protein [Dehalococcoidia bacterium]
MLIEVRIGPGKRKLTESILQVNRLSGTPVEKMHRVPHISLYGSFSADYRQVERVKEVLQSVGRNYSSLPYLIDGFRWINGRQGRVIYFNIIPSPGFKKFRQELAQRLLRIVPETRPFDKEEDFLYHSTLAYKLDSREFERIWFYVCSDRPPETKFSAHADAEERYMRYFYLPLHALRVTFLNDQSKILCEYDFLQQRLLTRSESLSSDEWGRTLKLFRIAGGIEGARPGGGRTPPYVISDLHLDHANIIEYCARPFLSSKVDEMNGVLVDNWNTTVGTGEIYFLGDLSLGKDSKPAGHWLGKLRGKKHLIRGRHDADIRDAREYEVVKSGRYTFLLAHDPGRLPVDWNGWVVHGHKHNNDMKNYPFINGDRKTINVCPELVNYRPVSLDFLSSLKLSSIRRMDTIDSIPLMR